jgi:hypothetical protein
VRENKIFNCFLDLFATARLECKCCSKSLLTILICNTTLKALAFSKVMIADFTIFTFIQYFIFEPNSTRFKDIFPFLIFDLLIFLVGLNFIKDLG